MNVRVSDFGDAIINIVGDAVYRKAQAVNALIEETAPKILEAVKASSPRKTGKYKRGWRLDKVYTEGRLVFVIHNKTHYRLTHLLENGTQPRTNRKGQNRGRIIRRPHIRAAALPLLDEFKTKLRNI